MGQVKSPAKTDPKAWVQELKTNRQTQLALLGAIAVGTWLLWPEAPKRPRRAAGQAAGVASVGADQRQMESLNRLPDLASLDRARELPSEDRMVRDLFLFEGQPPTTKTIPPKNIVKIPPPSEAQLAEMRLRSEKDMEQNQRPDGLRYLGFIESPSAGQLGSFLKGELPVIHVLGSMVGTRWRLHKLTDRKAEFQNIKFADMIFTLEAKDGPGASAAGAAASNEF